MVARRRLLLALVGGGEFAEEASRVGHPASTRVVAVSQDVRCVSVLAEVSQPCGEVGGFLGADVDDQGAGGARVRVRDVPRLGLVRYRGDSRFEADGSVEGEKL